MTGQICFLLNHRQICTDQPAGLTLLDYLRQTERLIGTKEGCHAGDCGACTVLLGECLLGEWNAEHVRYQAVTACLLPLGALQGKHVVTIEGINQANLSPVQQALVDFGATQCGFCTSGMVMSLTAYLLTGDQVNVEGVSKALSGNLCRCTGYGAIKRASASLMRSQSHLPLTIAEAINQQILPPYFADITERLRQLRQPVTEVSAIAELSEFAIAGGTDLYVQSGDLLPEVPVQFLSASIAHKGITTDKGRIHIGALTTFADFASHPAILQLIPQMPAYIEQIASPQIRNLATIGGNIVGASPIADFTILLLVLDALLVWQRGSQRRTLPIREFFLDYKQTDRMQGEILQEIILPRDICDRKIHFEKVSKRMHVDCAAVNSAIAIRDEADQIRELRISMGGVAPIPLLLQQTSNFLIGKHICRDTLEQSFPILQAEISPRSDIYGSEPYKRLLARQLLIAHFAELFPDLINGRELYATH
ncbi:FAD binding domain-containing protein [Pseudanabaena mucicola]|uniref:FAD binding domain-containing protein n=1 Tax=Pseudanabaena mucicola FACHB-723 TaxID=2692860 RepID=A0ABR7ZW83_9CYAN|nr:FAD binding domain-containing protein [Pseudanabaena mucicola]MBD2188029.1 FAD binding domain-containing protein [Pseudanabaena mucicola FACHB-723]